MTAKFQFPPVTEVVIGAYFAEPIASLRAEHVGIFWNNHRKKFPVIQQQPELMMPVPNQPMFAFGGEFYPMQRYWLTSADGSTILQIQKNAFLLNWKKTDQAYPHFEAVKESFDQQFATFKAFVASELGVSKIKVLLADLNYVNVITPGDYWASLDDTPKVIPRFSFPYEPRGGPGSANFHQVANEQLSSEINLTTTIRSANVASDASKPALSIELRVMGPVNSEDPALLDAWLENAHEQLVASFLKLTDPHIQKSFWKLGPA